MDEQNVKNEKKKELLNIYWFLLMVMAAISLVNLLAISTDSMKAAAIVNVVLLFAIPLTFVLGYIDFRNFAPMSVKKEFAYDATAVIALFISLIHFNVRNYTFMQDYTDENTYIIWVSVFAALYLAIAFICLLLTFLNFHSRKKQTKYYYATAIASIVSCVFLTAFNYNTTVTIFWAPLKLMGIQDGFVVDLGITVLALRVIVEYGIFIFHAVREKQKGGLPEGEETEYKKCVFIPSVITVVFMLVNVIVLPIISGMQNFYPDKKQGLFIAYEIVESLSVAALLASGIAICCFKKKSEKYGEIYLRQGLASIIFALVYAIMDFIPVGTLIGGNIIKAQIASDVFHSSIKIGGLAIYTLYVALRKPLNETLKKLDEEYAEKHSAENYSI